MSSYIQYYSMKTFDPIITAELREPWVELQNCLDTSFLMRVFVQQHYWPWIPYFQKPCLLYIYLDAGNIQYELFKVGLSNIKSINTKLINQSQTKADDFGSK